jgi:hypothetical protein
MLYILEAYIDIMSEDKKKNQSKALKAASPYLSLLAAF